jgi:hypothetical protein
VVSGIALHDCIANLTSNPTWPNGRQSGSDLNLNILILIAKLTNQQTGKRNQQPEYTNNPRRTQVLTDTDRTSQQLY